MSQPNVLTITDFYAAFARGDVAAALDAMAPDIHWLEAENYPYADGNPYIGPEAVLKGVLERVPAEWDEFVVEVDRIMDAGQGRVVSTGRYKGIFRATGKRIDAQMAHIWTVADGRITSFQQYADTYQVVNATRLV